MRTVFVTGAEGFLGSHFAAHLRSNGLEVIAGVRNRARKLAHERQFGKALVCDVADAINVARIIASVKPDAVAHFAGVSNPADAADDPLNACQSIVNAWTNVLDGVRRTVPRARVLMISAFDVYGNQSAQPVGENAAPTPLGTFGAMKLTAESIAHTFFRNYSLNVTIARPFNIIGAHIPETSFFGGAATKLSTWNAGVSGNELRFTNCNYNFDLLHVADATTAFHKLLTDGKPNEVYNVCAGKGMKCGDVLRMMAAAAGKQVNFADGGTPVEPRPALIGCNSKLAQQFNWSATHDMNDAVRQLMTSGANTSAANTTTAS